jgi:lipopolysaccharide biosynthesis protein
MIRPLAIYLPQFHPIPENDEAWGEGFTEWTNVKKARPLFHGHYQPHLPKKDPGYYDLRNPEIMVKQAEMAKEYGIHGFAFYHYWFQGKRLLNLPIDNMLNLGKPDFPFCFIWANEPWSKRWDGSENEIIQEQTYSEEDDLNHIKFLIPVFKDERYIKVNGKPLFAIYKSADFPDISKTIQIWREEAAKEGLELYICLIDRWKSEYGQQILDLGFEASIEFQPLSPSLDRFLKREWTIGERIRNRISKIIDKYLNGNRKVNQTIIDLKKFVDFDNRYFHIDHKCYPCVCPSWDNSARKKEAIIFTHSSPKVFYKWTKGKLNRFTPYSKDENFLFINAWNEWAEGNHLEPCQKWGKGYLEALKKALDENK